MGAFAVFEQRPALLIACALLIVATLALIFATTIAVHFVRWRGSRLPEGLSERLLEEWMAELNELGRVRQLTFALGALLTRRRTFERAFDTDAPPRPDGSRLTHALKWFGFFAYVVALDYVVRFVLGFMPDWTRVPSMVLALVLGAICIHRINRSNSPLLSLDLNERDSRVE